MMHWSDANFRAAEIHVRELHAQAAQGRLARQARRTARRRGPRRWQHRVGALLIVIGEALAGPALDAACRPARAPRRGGT